MEPILQKSLKTQIKKILFLLSEGFLLKTICDKSCVSFYDKIVQSAVDANLLNRDFMDTFVCCLLLHVNN